MLRAVIAIAALVGASMLLVAAVSFAKPQLPTERLYEISQWARWTALVTVIVGVLALSLLKLVSDRTIEVREIVQRMFQKIPVWFKASVAVCLLLLLSTAIYGFRNVHAENGVWISTGHAGRWPVTEAIARTYLWLSIRASSLITVLMALVVSFAGKRMLVTISPSRHLIPVPGNQE